jgi:hypothetical protein
MKKQTAQQWRIEMDNQRHYAYSVEQVMLPLLGRAFVMVSLAAASHAPRNTLETLSPDLKIIPITDDALIAKLKEVVLNGDVTCIVPAPEPFVFIHHVSTGMRTVYGIWVGRKASWRGAITIPKSQLLTREQAIAQGIPLPDEVPFTDEGAPDA